MTESIPTPPDHYVPPQQLTHIQRRQQLEAERRARILHEKTRTIGLDVKTLDAQVEARKQFDAASKNENNILEQNVLAMDNTLKLVEIERHRLHVDATKDVVDFNKKYLKKEDRREYELSDPHTLRKDKLPTDNQIGVSSVQRFTGEDTHKSERIRAQQAQQRQWLNQQVFEKSADKESVNVEVAQYDASQRAMLTLREQLEAEENALRKDVTLSAMQYNEGARNAKWEGRNEKRPYDERLRESEEMHAQSKCELLNESTAQYNTNGRIRRDHYRGASQEECSKTNALNSQQIEYKKQLVALDKAASVEHDRQIEASRRALVAIEKDRMERYHDIVAQEMQTNVMPTLEEKKLAKKVPTSEIGEEFFTGFGTSCR